MSVILTSSIYCSSFFGALASKKLKATRLKLALGLFMITASVLIAIKPSDDENEDKKPFESLELTTAVPFYGTIGSFTPHNNCY